MIQEYTADRKLKEGKVGLDKETEKELDLMYQSELYDILCAEIQRNIDRRNDHQACIEKNTKMIADINERCNYISMSNKKLLASINKIQKNAKTGIGSDSILTWKNYDTLQIHAGKLEEL